MTYNNCTVGNVQIKEDGSNGNCTIEYDDPGPPPVRSSVIVEVSPKTGDRLLTARRVPENVPMIVTDPNGVVTSVTY